MSALESDELAQEPGLRAAPEEINWDRIDKVKFVAFGAGLFSGVTLCLFPLSVVKTRQMALDGAPLGLLGAAQTARGILRQDGVRGLYRGFGTVILGMLPGRVLYLNTLEFTKMLTLRAIESLPISLNEAQVAGTANFVGGSCASLITQSVMVPVDVVSQRQMVAGGLTTAASAGSLAASSHHRSGLQVVRQILKQEGVRGLYRGFGASIATFVPGSGLWWGFYGTYQKLIWSQVDRWAPDVRSKTPQEPSTRATGDLLAVQTASALLSGLTSSVFTTPLDVIKTRLQVADRAEGAERPTVRSIVTRLLAEDGPRGLWRGLAPRMASVSMWGTAMVTTYEFLKRTCVIDPQEGG